MLFSADQTQASRNRGFEEEILECLSPGCCLTNPVILIFYHYTNNHLISFKQLEIYSYYHLFSRISFYTPEWSFNVIPQSSVWPSVSLIAGWILKQRVLNKLNRCAKRMFAQGWVKATI